MDNPKTLLVKSKSSNSTYEAKRNSLRNEKISRSNAEFLPKSTMYGTQPLMHRKRGVYVEKKPTKISINITEPSPDVPQIQTASRPRAVPRPSKKRFLTSVLTILSKSTAGTQCPEDCEANRKMDKKIKLQIRREQDDLREEQTASQNVAKRKTKVYKSRVLNSLANRESVRVLQSKKDITVTSSNNSACINVKYDANLLDRGTVKWAESLVRNSRESVASHSKKVTPVAKDSKTVATVTDKVNDKSFYNFFVDIMKTTNVYKAETEEDTQNLPESGNSSKITLLEIKQSVARKKKQPKVEEDAEERKKEKKSQPLVVSRKPSSHRAYSVKPEEKDVWTNRQLIDRFQPQKNQQKVASKPPAPSTKRKKKIQSDSFQYKKPSTITNTISLPMPSKKKPSKNDPKKNFLKVIKAEIQMKADAYEEPENFYEALKVIARNKRRSQKWRNEAPSEEDDHVCQFKPRRVLSRKSSPKQRYYVEPTRSVRTAYIPVLPTYKKQKRKIIKDQHPQQQPQDNETDYSNHSLEVVGYDYEKVKPVKKLQPQITPPRSILSGLKTSQTAIGPETPPNIIEDYSSDYWDDYSHSETSAMIEQRQYLLQKLEQI